MPPYSTLAICSYTFDSCAGFCAQLCLAAVSAADIWCNSSQSAVLHTSVCPPLVVSAATVSAKKQRIIILSYVSLSVVTYLELAKSILDNLNCFVQLLLFHICKKRLHLHTELDVKIILRVCINIACVCVCWCTGEGHVREVVLLDIG